MPKYKNVTNTEEIKKQIKKNLQDTDAAIEALKIIDNLCEELDIKEDPISQWLGALSKEFKKVQKWKTSKDLIEIYPSGTTGIGKSDRLKFQVGESQVRVVEAYESEH